ncbi:hypothetical protein [Denitrobaculum tricleocarpae]|uniref:Uncharacterized protein n=1 Tax=Denitrobaculum tricleocarpae TaxID=2591009 RepID=A0A545TQ08_9PROT|nr:hypothetical protein [Denitrobaculum tricleocarpae]TQV79313.1 hypothetical protein FKG95_16835 [Denitrobaculum tricleocarpae]
MKGAVARPIAVNLLAVAVLLFAFGFKPSTNHSAIASEPFWSGDMQERYYRHCVTQVMRTRSRIYPDAVHKAFCDCQISEAEKWLRASDMTFILAYIDGESHAELTARALALPKSEARGSERRMGQYTKSSTQTCGKALLDAVAEIINAQ